MPRVKSIFSVILFTCFMLLPQSRIGNTNFGHSSASTPPTITGGYTVADGDPFPPLPPKKPLAAPATLIADGDPFPPLPPKKPLASPATLVADGDPFPPLPPKKPAANVPPAYNV